MILTRWLRRLLEPWSVSGRRSRLARRYVSLPLRRLEPRRVLNVTSVNAGANATIDEGQTYLLDPASFVDNNLGNTPHTATVDWGDGNSSTETSGLAIFEPTLITNGLVAGSHIYAEDGSYTVRVTVDGPGGGPRSDTLTVTVNNVAPTANHGGSYFVPIDGSVGLNATATDPGGLNDPLTFSWDLDNDGTFGETGASAIRGDETGQTPTFNANGLSPGSTHTIKLRVADDDGGTTTVTTTVNVNHAPTIAAINNQSLLQNQHTGPITLAIADAETVTTALTLSASTTNAALVPLASVVFDTSGPQPTMTITPTNNAWGKSDITITVTDADGASASTTFTLLVNDAPTLTGSSFSLGSTSEDAPTSGTLVSTLLTTAGYTDANTAAAAGIAISAVSGNGGWEYSTDNGSSWLAITPVANNSALLLSATSLVRYAPDGQNGETASLTFRAWDQTSGTALNKVDTTTHGGTSAFSATTAQASISVTSVNDAPTLSGGPVSLGSIDENTTSASIAVSTILAGVTITDVDTAALSGIAITTLVGNGTWEYSLDNGSSWLALSPVTSASALLLAPTHLVRYTPDGQNGETASLTFRAWDQSAGTLGGRVNTNTHGGTTAYSSSTAQATLTVTSVNDAPTLGAGTYTFAAITEDSTSASVTVATLLTTAGYSDVDSGASGGIAVSAASGNGTWQYSTDNGSSWLAITPVANNSALLLDVTTLVRYVGDGQNGETASLTFRAWDQTSGTALSKVDTTTHGGTSAFSATTAQASISVTSVNDAPTLSGGPVSLGSIDENTTSASIAVSTILAGVTITDVDTAALSGIAITTLVGNGTWEYSLDNGSSWLAIDPVTSASALLLAPTHLVRYTPDGQNGETASFTFRAWDQSAGTLGGRVNTNTNGGTTAYSSSTAQATLTVTSVNDAPSLGAGSYTFATTDENTTSVVVTVNTILASVGFNDLDTGTTAGIAVTGASGLGNWQYFHTSTSTWTNVGVVNDSAGLLLSGAIQLRYQPNLANGETATLTFRAWDQSSGTLFTKVNTATQGGTSAFSTNSGSTSIAVTSVNDAPTLSGGSVALGPITEDAISAPIAVSTILAGVTVGDVDSGALSGVALTATTGLGTWEYSLDAGANWSAVGPVTTGSALLLASDALVRYQPNGQNGETATLAFRAWDRTSGSSGSTADTTANGGTTPFSTATASASLSVTSINDAPTINPGSFAFTATNEDTPSNSVLVSAILTVVGRADVDTGASSGIAVTATSGLGSWQFFNTTTATWQAFGPVSDSAALLLTSGTQLRYAPNLANGESASFTFRAWDQTSGTELSKVDTSAAGGTSAFSLNTAQATIAVTSVNDAPTVSGGPVVLTATNEDTPSGATSVATILAGVTINDVDTGAQAGIAVTARVGSGTWRYSLDGGVNWLDLTGVSNTAALLLPGSALVMYLPDGRNAETASLTFRGWDQSSGAAGSTANTGSPGGTSAFSTSTAQATLAVTAVNDAPTLVGGTFNFTSITEDATSAAVTISTMLAAWGSADVDSGALSGVAIIGSVGNGTWQYSTGGGVWINLGTVDPTQALLLTSSTQLRYLGDTRNGELATLTFRAWDQTNGSAGLKVDATVVGGVTSFSTITAQAALVVTSVNDAPTLSGDPVALIGTDEDTLSAPQTVASILAGLSIGDVDTAANTGLAVIGASGNGAWQYSIDGGVNWLPLGTVTSASALLLDGAAFVRYQPDLLNTETATLTVRAWDQSSGSVGSRVNTTTAGGVTPFSLATAQATLVVSPVNDAPTISPIAGQLIQMNQALAPVSFVIGDVDVGDVLNVTATSSHPALIAPGGITLGGSGVNRTIALAPLANQSGEAIITLTVTDTAGHARSSAFTVRVNAAPTIVATADQLFQRSVFAQTLGPLPLTLHDADTLDVLTVSVTSTDQTLIPNAGLTLGGSGNHRTLSLAPIAGRAGTTLITVTVADGFGGQTSDTFAVRLNAPPTIVVPGNQLIQRNTTLGPVTFTVHDADPGDTLNVTALSSVGSLVPSGNIVITGSGATRTVTVVPGLDQFGSTLITLTVSDGAGGSASGQFSLRVNAPPALVNPAASVVNVDATTTFSTQIVDDNTLPVTVEIVWGDISTNDTLVVTPPGSLAIDHTYLSPPDPSNPSAPVSIVVVLRDAEGGVTNEVVIAHVSGNGIPVPILRALGDVRDVAAVRNIDLPAPIESTPTPIAANTLSSERSTITEQTETTRRQVLLRVVSATGDEQAESYVLPESVMQDVQALLKRLPDGRYRLYLVEDAITPPRLMIDVYVQRGRAVSPADMQADRTPTPSAREQSGEASSRTRQSSGVLQRDGVDPTATTRTLASSATEETTTVRSTTPLNSTITRLPPINAPTNSEVTP